MHLYMDVSYQSRTIISSLFVFFPCQSVNHYPANQWIIREKYQWVNELVWQSYCKDLQSWQWRGRARWRSRRGTWRRRRWRATRACGSWAAARAGSGCRRRWSCWSCWRPRSHPSDHCGGSDWTAWSPCKYKKVIGWLLEGWQNKNLTHKTISFACMAVVNKMYHCFSASCQVFFLSKKEKRLFFFF